MYNVTFEEEKTLGHWVNIDGLIQHSLTFRSRRSYLSLRQLLEAKKRKKSEGSKTIRRTGGRKAKVEDSHKSDAKIVILPIKNAKNRYRD